MRMKYALICSNFNFINETIKSLGKQQILLDDSVKNMFDFKRTIINNGIPANKT